MQTFKEKFLEVSHLAIVSILAIMIATALCVGGLIFLQNNNAYKEEISRLNGLISSTNKSIAKNQTEVEDLQSQIDQLDIDTQTVIAETKEKYPIYG